MKDSVDSDNETMGEKPNRLPPSSPSSLAVVSSIGLKGALGALPGGSILYDLLKARRDQMTSAMREESEKRLDAFYAAMLEAPATLDEQQASAFLTDADFHALLRACVADIEAEKVRAYAALARGIATGSVAPQNRRHFILSLRDLSAEELTLLRKAYVSRTSKLIPTQGAGEVREAEFLTTGTPGSFQSIHVANLTARGYVHEAKLSSLGQTFAKAIWREHELTPESIGLATWTGHNVLIIDYEIGVPQTDRIANTLTDGLRCMRCKSSTASVTRESQQQARMIATSAVLLVGDEKARMEQHLEPLASFLAKVPTVAVLVTPGASVPAGLSVVGTVTYDEAHVDAGLSGLSRFLFGASAVR